MCEGKELLITCLYDEANDAERRAFESHLTGCVECRRDLEALRSTRGRMRAWSPPDSDLGFQIVRTGVTAAPRRWVAPAWGLAAAAVLVLAAAAAIANIEVRYGSDGLVVRTGWNRAAPAPVSAAPASGSDAGAAPVDFTQELAAVDRRLRDLEATASRTAPATQLAGSQGMSDAEVVRRVRDMVAQSETRQQRELVLRINALAREVDRQRRVDLAMMQQGLQAASGEDALRHSQIFNALRSVAQQQQSK